MTADPDPFYGPPRETARDRVLRLIGWAGIVGGPVEVRDARYDGPGPGASAFATVAFPDGGTREVRAYPAGNVFGARIWGVQWLPKGGDAGGIALRTEIAPMPEAGFPGDIPARPAARRAKSDRQADLFG